MAMVILRLFLFLLPFLLFFFWIRYRRQLKKGDIEPNPEIEKRLMVSTVLTVIAVLSGVVYMTMNSETNEDKDYIPPQTVDGEIKPGHFKKEDDPKG